MKHRTFVLIPLALIALTALPAGAEDSRMIMPMDGRVTAEIHRGQGKVNSVDVKAGRLNITHEPIASLGWSTMTMDFEVQDKNVLTKLKAGQKVAFTFIDAGNGKYVISEITVIK